MLSKTMACRRPRLAAWNNACRSCVSNFIARLHQPLGRAPFIAFLSMHHAYSADPNGRPVRGRLGRMLAKSSSRVRRSPEGSSPPRARGEAPRRLRLRRPAPACRAACCPAFRGCQSECVFFQRQAKRMASVGCCQHGTRGRRDLRPNAVAGQDDQSASCALPSISTKATRAG